MAALLVSIGLSQLLAGNVPWWVMLIILVVLYLLLPLIAIPFIRNTSLIKNYIQIAVLGSVIGILAVNAYRRKHVGKTRKQVAIVIHCPAK